MPRYSSGKGNKRGASQPPAKEPPAKVHALSARISSMDKALMFGEDDVGMNVTGLIENALNEIMAAGDLVIEGALQLAKLFILICGFVKFAFAPVPGQNFPGVFEVGPKTGKGKKVRPEESDEDSDGEASGAEAAAARAVRMLSGKGADDLHYIITNLESLCTQLFAFARSRDFEDAEKNSLSFAFGNWAQFQELRDCLTMLKAAAPDFYSIPKSQLAHYDNKVTVLQTAEKLYKLINKGTANGMIEPNTNAAKALNLAAVKQYFIQYKGTFSILDSRFSTLDSRFSILNSQLSFSQMSRRRPLAPVPRQTPQTLRKVRKRLPRRPLISSPTSRKILQLDSLKWKKGTRRNVSERATLSKR